MALYLKNGGVLYVGEACTFDGDDVLMIGSSTSAFQI
jgi:hypothetical protein